LVVIVVELVFMCTALRQSPQLSAQTLALWICGILMLVADAITLSWVGMATALRARSPNHASVSTITRVLILPWILLGLVIGIANILSFFGSPEPGWKFYLGWWFAFGIIADVGFGFIAKWNLQNRFRELALQRFTKVAPRTPR
jgi:hypothetical protein